MKNIKIKNLSKILVLLLSVALAVTALVLVVGAEDGDVAELTLEGGKADSYPTFDDAIAAFADAGQNGKITLLKNGVMDAAVTLPGSKSLEIDLGGKTLTVGSADTSFTAFNFTSGSNTLSITGNGVLDVNVPTLYNGSAAGDTLHIEGTTGKIEIDHVGTGVLLNLQQPASGKTNTLKNVKITSATTNQSIISALVQRVTLNMTGVEVIAKSGVATNGTVSIAVIDAGSLSQHQGYNFDYCKFDTNLSTFTSNSWYQAETTINNSYIVSTGGSLIYNTGNVLTKNIYINNSYVKYLTYMNVRNDNRGYNYTLNLDNSTLELGQSTAFSRSIPIKLTNGSKIIAPAGTGTRLFSNATAEGNNPGFSVTISLKDGGTKTVNNILLLLSNGSRLSQGMYDFVMDESKYYALEGNYFNASQGAFAFEDGSSILSSATYQIVYDPIGDADVPYVVTKTDAPAINTVDMTTTEVAAENLPADDTTSISGVTIQTTAMTVTKSNEVISLTKNTGHSSYAITGYYVITERTLVATKAADSSSKTVTLTEYTFEEVTSNETGVGSALCKQEIADAATRSVWGTAAGVTVSQTTEADGNAYTLIKPTGNGNAIPMVGYPINTNTETVVSSKRVFVVSINVSAENQNGFTPISNFSLSARHCSDNADKSTGVMSIAQNGVVKAHGAGAEVESVQFTAGIWNNITYIVDTSSGTNYVAYGFANGKYMGSINGGNADTNILGFRIHQTGGTNGYGTDTALMIDNFIMTGYSTYSVEGTPTALDIDVIKKLFANEIAWSNPDNSDENITISGVPVYSVDKALEVSAANGLIAELRGDVTIPQTVTQNGVIITNGYSLEIASESIPSKTNKDENGNIVSYDFNSAYNYTVNYQFYTGTPGDAEEMAKAENYTDVVSLAINAVPAEDSNAVNNNMYAFLDNTRHYYSSTKLLGWSTDGNPLAAPDTNAITFEFAEAYNSTENPEPIKMYPVYNTPTVAYKAIILDADGNFSRKAGSAADSAQWWDTAKRSIQLKYGETLVLQTNIETQGTFINAPGGTSATFVGGSDPSKTYGIDLNGYTLKLDSNISQTTMMSHVNAWFSIKEGETLNFYSSRAGGKVESYGIQTSILYSIDETFINTIKMLPVQIQKNGEGDFVNTAAYGEGNEATNVLTLNINDVYKRTNGETYTYDDLVKLLGGTSGKKCQKSFWITPDTMHTIIIEVPNTSTGNYTFTEKYQRIHGLSGGSIFDISEADGAKLNIGTFGDYAGSNLTLEGSTIFSGYHSDTESVVNVDGITFIRTEAAVRGSQQSAPFFFNYYSGSLNINNSTFINPADDTFIYGNRQTGEIGSITVNNSTVIVKTNGANILDGNLENTITFTGVTTNGVINNLAASTVILGEGNTYVSTTAATAEGIENAIYDNNMEIPSNVIKVTYYTLPVDLEASIEGKYDFSSNGFEYTANVLYFAEIGAEVNAADGDTVVTLPVLGYKSTATENTASLTYKDLDGNIIVTEVYVKGTAVRGTEVVIPEKEFAALNVTVNGFDVPEIISSDVVLTPEYDASVKISGVLVNVAVYSDFGVNIYVPADYEDIISILTDGTNANYETVEIEGKLYNKYTVIRESYQSEKIIAVTFNVTEGIVQTSKTSEITVVQYVTMVLGQEQPVADVDADLMYYMLNYAQEANKYFNNNNVSSAIQTILDNNTPSVDYDYSTSENLFAVAPEVEDAGITMSIDLKSSNLKYVFTITGTDTVAVKLNGKTYEAVGDTVTIENLKVYNFAKPITFIINGTEYNYSLAHCVASYMTSDDANANAAANLVEAFYQYAQAATAYKAASTAAEN